MTTADHARVGMLRESGIRTRMRHLRYYAIRDIQDPGLGTRSLRRRALAARLAPSVARGQEAKAILGPVNKGEVRQFRAFLDQDGYAATPVTIEPKGGGTVVRLEDAETGELLALGQAVCSREDNFSRTRGVQIALGRALHFLAEEEPERAAPGEPLDQGV